MIVIGFAGPAGSGKTTAANIAAAHLQTKHNTAACVIPFASVLKSAAYSCGFNKEKEPALYREFCQYVGAMARKVDPEWWVKRWADSVASLAWDFSDEEQKNLVVIADDVRFPNEMSKIQEMGGTVYFVRPPRSGTAGAPGGPPAMQAPTWALNPVYEHESEKLAMDELFGDEPKFDPYSVLMNEKTLEDFADRVKVAISDEYDMRTTGKCGETKENG